MRPGQRGFTLIEVMVAVAVAALVLTSVYGVFTTLSAAKSRLDASARAHHLARVLFDRLGKELRAAHYVTTNPRTLLEGEMDDKGRGALEFSTSAGRSETGGMVRIRYRLEPEDGGFALWRSEAPLFAAPDTRGYRLTGGVESVGARFFDGQSWHDRWSTETRKELPRIVEIAFRLRVDDRVYPFVSAFEMPARRGN